MAQPPINKHVFLEYSEYQRFLELKRRNEELVEKIRMLEEKVRDLEEDRQGHGFADLVAKEQAEKLKPPLVGMTESITLPPSAQIGGSNHRERPWYFLGPPKYEGK